MICPRCRQEIPPGKAHSPVPWEPGATKYCVQHPERLGAVPEREIADTSTPTAYCPHTSRPWVECGCDLHRREGAPERTDK